jgi:cyclomaltodextrinase
LFLNTFMSFSNVTRWASLALLLTVSALSGCKDDTPSPPSGPVTPVTSDPAQYGTPFAGVPDPQDAVIYQVNMRAFSNGGKFAGVTARLDSIKNLGANVVYLMPIYPIGVARGVNSPYAVKDYLEVNAEFGTLTDLRTLVDAAHARGLSVMLDWVANHTSWDNLWVTQHKDWYQQDASGNIITPPGTTFTDVAQLNFSNSTMRLAMIAAMKSWVYKANVDGFRFDYADGPPASFWQQANDTLRRVRSHKLLLLAEGGRSANFTAGFDYNFGFSFYDRLKTVYGSNQAATGLEATNLGEFAGASTAQSVVHYTTNHDVNSSDGTPVALYNGKAGAMSAFVIAALYKGVPMIYNGQEQGMTTPITFPFTSVKVRWEAQPDVTRAYRQLLKARAASAALRRGTPTIYSTADVCAFTKTSGAEQALVLVNVRNASRQFNVPAAFANTAWTNALDGSAMTVGSQVSLPAYGYLVLKK